MTCRCADQKPDAVGGVSAARGAPVVAFVRYGACSRVGEGVRSRPLLGYDMNSSSCRRQRFSFSGA